MDTVKVQSSMTAVRSRILASLIDAVIVGAISILALAATVQRDFEYSHSGHCCAIVGVFAELLGVTEWLKTVSPYAVIFCVAIIDVTLAAGIPFLLLLYLVLPDTCWAAFALPINCLYHIGFEVSHKATPGKLMMGLQISSSNGGRIRIWQPIVRHAAKFITLCASLIPVAYYLTCNRRQLLHDRIASVAIDVRHAASSESPSSRASSSGPERKQAQLVPASVQRRIIASILDAALFDSLVSAAILAINGVVARMELWQSIISRMPDLSTTVTPPISDDTSMIRSALLNLLISWPAGILLTMLLFALMEASPFQATLGKLIAGVQVTDLEGRRANLWHSFQKQIAQGCVYLSLTPIVIVPICFTIFSQAAIPGQVANICCCLFYLAYGATMCITLQNGQTFIDKISTRFVVIKPQPNRILAAVILPVLLAGCYASVSCLSLDPYTRAWMIDLAQGEWTLGEDPKTPRFMGATMARYYGFIDKSGKLVIPAKYEDARSFKEGLCAVRLNNRFGFIDKAGLLVIPARFQQVHDFSEGLAAVRENRIYGFINPGGECIIRPKDWVVASNFKHSLSVVGVLSVTDVNPYRHSIKYGIIDRSGNYLCKPDLDFIKAFPDGIRRTQRNDQYGFVDFDGRIITEPRFEHAGAFSEGQAPVCEKGTWGYIDKSGQFVIAPTFQNAQEFHNGLAVVETDGCFGLIDHNGSFVLKPTYRYLTSAHLDSPSSQVFKADGLIPVGYRNRWGFADSTGRMVIEPQYASVASFSEGLCCVAVYSHPELVTTESFFLTEPENQELNDESTGEDTYIGEDGN